MEAAPVTPERARGRPRRADDDAPGTPRRPIPRAVREQLWIERNGRVFEAKCGVVWCRNAVTVFDFEAGHDVPASRGGSNELQNLRVICGNCNRSMGNRYTLAEWDRVLDGPARAAAAPAPAAPPEPRGCCAIA